MTLGDSANDLRDGPEMTPNDRRDKRANVQKDKRRRRR